MELKLDETHKVSYCQSETIEEFKKTNRTSFCCVSDFDIREAVNVKNVSRFYTSEQRCAESLFNRAIRNETVIKYDLRNGYDEIRYISLWKLKNLKFGSDSIIRVKQGKGRVLRFKNVLTGAVKDLNLIFDNTWFYISRETMNLFTLSFPPRRNVKNSTYVHINVLLMEVAAVRTASFAPLKDGMDKACCICLNDFTQESVFYPHDGIHPICTECSFILVIEKQFNCPICRKEFVL
jgi:hypothetical protein